MARSFHVHGAQAARVRIGRWAHQPDMILILLIVAGLAALWVAGAPAGALLPIEPPA